MQQILRRALSRLNCGGPTEAGHRRIPLEVIYKRRMKIIEERHCCRTRCIRPLADRHTINPYKYGYEECVLA